MTDVNLTPKEITSMMGLVDTYIRWRNYNARNDRSYLKYHPSELGKCLRYQQYKHYTDLGYIKVDYKPFESKILRLFDKGHWMHERWASYFEDIGILTGYWKCKNPLCYMFNDDGSIDNSNKKINEVYTNKKTRIYGLESKTGVFKPEKCKCGCKDFSYEEISVKDDNLNIYGHCDVVLDCSNFDFNKFKDVPCSFDKNYLPKKGEKVVGDMKTIGQSAWDYQIEKKGAHKYYIIQLITYIHLLDCNYGLLMYENKNNSEMRWYKIERNDKWWDIIKWQMQKMIEMKDKKELPPPRPDTKTCYECKDCDYKKLCHASGVWDSPKFDSMREYFYKELL